MKRIKFISILALLLTVTQGAWALDGSGTPADPYIINTYDDWTTFVDGVNGGTYGATACAKLTSNAVNGTTYRITQTYQGTFDGNGYTITTASNVPLFPSVNGATIKNLVLHGNVSFSESGKGALIGTATGTTTIQNCRISSSVTYTIVAANCGCVVGYNQGTLNMTGCVFDGALTVANNIEELGGLVRSSSGGANLQNCIFKPASLTGTPSIYCCATGRGSTSLSNSYFFTALSPEHNDFNPARSISAGTDVTISGLGGATATYNVSGITAYTTGIKYNGVYYASNGQSVTLTLSHADKDGYTFSQYTATPGTLSSQTETSATLTMTDANQTVSATWTQNTATLTDGDDLSALSTYAGKTCTVTYSRSFTADKPSTVCLPFAYATASAGGTFYTFTGISKPASEYIADMTEYTGANLVANTPYLFKASATGSVNFGGTYAIPADLTAGTTTSGDWTFVGTYTEKKWDTAPTGIYGFSAQNVGENISQGEFVKVGAYVRVKPMRCYLKYKNGGEDYAGARAMTRAAATDEPLPETIKVRLIGANGEVTAIGTLHTQTGEVVLDGWYTLDGTRLSGQPTRKGIYVNNGKKVIIK